MKPHILITGISGLIGRSVLNKLLAMEADIDITALVRPNTAQSRINQFGNKIRIEYLDLGDTYSLQKHLETSSYDIIIHIGALRGGRKATKAQYYNANVKSTEQFVEYALIKKARLVFCSSVGVFGAIPEEMPANDETPYKDDNYYHYTKIQSEKYIEKAILKGLNAVIVRPSITYGTGDHGFPLQLVKLVKFGIFPLSSKNVWIHLCHIDTITAAIVNLSVVKTDIRGRAFNIADMEPVQLKDLISFTNRQIYNKNYPAYKTIDNHLLMIGERLARLIKNELWTSRFELISHSWFYQVSDAYRDLDLPMHFTIPDFKVVISDYLNRG